MSWTHTPAPITTGTMLALIALAVFTGALAAGQWWLCRRRHCGPHPCAMGRLVAWDDQPPAEPAAVAEVSRDTFREAS